jgi:cyclopropane fatty-acyl-phospholipid synthase-like methyltransferase
VKNKLRLGWDTNFNEGASMQKENRKYYEAYEDRYKTAHEKGVSWAQMKNTPIVMDIISRYHLHPEHSLLEIGCGEGRDSSTVLENGFNLMATDISPEAINYCKKKIPDFESKFMVLDCLSSDLDMTFDFIYSIAVIHMLVLDEDRNGFYQFIHSHLKSDGIALICSMGDGKYEMQSDISNAFEIQEREHESGKMMVAGTSCRMVSFSTFENELLRNGLKIIEKGITSAMPNFNSLMYAVVQ